MKTITIGRSTENNVVIEDKTVSGRHLSITQSDKGDFFVQDLNSTNGTFVNGKKIDNQPLVLQYNDVIKIGEVVLSWQKYFEVISSSRIPENTVNQNITEQKSLNSPNKKSVLSTVGIIIFAIICVFIITLLNSRNKRENDDNYTSETENQETPNQTPNENLSQQDGHSSTSNENGQETIQKKIRNNWYAFIKASVKDYQYREIGGLQNIQIMVSNLTQYPIDKMNIVVSYIKKNGEIYESKEMEIDNIDANSDKIVYAPDSNRGTSVEVRIMGIRASSFSFNYVPGNWANNSDDPYRMR